MKVQLLKEGKKTCEFIENSHDSEENRLLLHIAAFKLFLFCTLWLLQPGSTVSGENDQADSSEQFSE